MCDGPPEDRHYGCPEEGWDKGMTKEGGESDDERRQREERMREDRERRDREDVWEESDEDEDSDDGSDEETDEDENDDEIVPEPSNLSISL